MVYQIKGQGLATDGKARKHYFRKPWAMTTVMFIGMTFCLPLHKAEKRKRKALEAESRPLLVEDDPMQQPKSKWRVLLLLFPTLADLIATVLMNIGLLYTTVSVYQMMRGAELVFAALFAIVFLKRHLNSLHFAGIFCSVCGIILVGVSSLLSADLQSGKESKAAPVHGETSGLMLLGMGLIILSQAVQAAQLTFEDYFMADLNIEPLKIVGYEGLFGTMMMIFIMLPAVYFIPGYDTGGRQENTLDTLTMIWKTPALSTIIIGDMFALMMYNFAGMSVTDHLGAVFRTLLETMRTLAVWGVDVVLYYSGTGVGEPIDKYSVIQLLGFVVLVVGMLVYGKGDDKAALEEMEKYLALEGEEEAPVPAGEVPEEHVEHTEAVPMFSPYTAKPTMNIASYSKSPAISSSYMAHSLTGSFGAGHFSSPRYGLHHT